MSKRCENICPDCPIVKAVLQTGDRVILTTKPCFFSDETPTAKQSEPVVVLERENARQTD